MPARAGDGHVPVPAAPFPAVAYIRVSTAREQMISPELQRAAIEDRARRDGAMIGEWIEELDESGRGFGRKGVQRAIRLVRDGAAAAVYVWKYSRFGRNAALVAQYVGEMEAIGGRLVSATEDVDASTAAGRFARGMLWQVDEFYSNVAGEQWQEAHARRRRDGLPHNGNPRFGYAYHRAATARRPCPQGCAAGECADGYVPDPATAGAARRAYEAYNGGTSVLKVAVELNRRGLAAVSGKPWDQRTLRRYMDSGFCAGLLRVHDPACEHPVRECPRRVLIPGAHEPLITPGTWQEYLRQRKARASLPPRAESPVYPLAGLVRCGKCGQPMHAHPMTYRGVRYPGYMYHCSRYAKSRGCAGSWMARRRLEQAVRGWLAAVAGDIETTAAVPRHRGASAAAEADRRRLAAAAKRAEEDLARLTVLLASEVISAEAYRLARDRIAGRRAQIGAALEAAAVAAALPSGPPPAAVTWGLARNWDVLPVTTRQQALRALISRVEVESYGKSVPAKVTVFALWGDVHVLSL
jgi:DNA invertase Pin-like site-specific DNA recombinase